MRLLLLLLGLLLALVAPAAAHPHIFIDAKARIIFNDQGEVTGIENSWTFDEAFSAWQTTELDVNQDGTTSTEEMAELAQDNIAGLAEYEFYTYAGEGNSTLPLASMDNAFFVYENGRSTFTFGVEPQGPYRIKDTFEVAIYDPEYYVAINIPDASAITLENAPEGCTVSLQPPKEMPQELADQLYSLPPDMLKLPPELAAALRGVQGGIEVKCPGAGPAETTATAAEAVTQVAEAAPAKPFGGPPPEPGFIMPKTGFLGWIAEQQRTFYQALTEALGQLKTDGNAFFVLGTLSFLYGIFHAAGPGHGKVVISSYVLANERQVRRGIVLSFAAALLQAAVAVAFVLVAQLLLSMTSLAMSDAANWIGIASYGLVALLGLWLIGRKIFSWGHGHRQEQDLTEKAHAHLHEHEHTHHHHEHEQAGHGHAHIVTPDQVRGNWREQLGVVLAVGARPCSGALVVLVFALSQGLLAAGIASVFLMGLGTAITVAILATLAVSAKGLALRFAGSDGGVAAGLVWWGELVGAMLVFTFGVMLLLASI